MRKNQGGTADIIRPFVSDKGAFLILHIINL